MRTELDVSAPFFVICSIGNQSFNILADDGRNYLKLIFITICELVLICS